MAKITNLERPAGVEMVNTGKVTRKYTQVIGGYGVLQRQLKVSPKAVVTLNKPGFKMEVFVESVSLLIGIGKDHTAEIIMTREAYEAFVSGEKIDITHKKDFLEWF